MAAPRKNTPHLPRQRRRPADAWRRLPARLRQGILWGVMLLALLAGGAGYYLFYPNLYPPEQPYFLHIHRGETYEQVLAKLEADSMLRDPHGFDVVARALDYPNGIRPGRYRVRRHMSNLRLVLVLRNGLQTPLELSFTTTRTKKELAARFGRQLEYPADSFLAVLNDTAFLRPLGFTPETVMAMFLPNSYEVYWTVHPRALVERMHREYKSFWTEERREQAEAQGLTPLQVSILASIVQAETYRADERARVAGVYLNRLRINMPLQADPTVIFALQDWSIRRVLRGHLQYDSPYNTYKYTGLPPGPINAPSTSAIDAVLQPEEHDYLFFSARPDFSGYHNFSVDYRSHVNSANRYRRKLSAQERQRSSR